ncbi:MAG: hypothetical protein DME49_12395 [Verrucomicrobia bacterium]|nr:MAG: hypothetical protein DME49_12395 [Verrucomicrobiota bacterium]PYK94687.1 MAG: hypothetical protein DME36_04745 [Verrucomicrobiota bacterium]PYL56657.1 MAG: hypothetical protein DMF30_09100 [Verrucomicrobiota bacterium]
MLKLGGEAALFFSIARRSGRSTQVDRKQKCPSRNFDSGISKIFTPPVPFRWMARSLSVKGG